MYEMAMKKKLF